MLSLMKIRTWTRAAAALAALTLTAAAGAADFKLYPGAVKYTPPDTESNRQFESSLRPGLTVTAYFTKDSFEKVLAFYKGLGREYTNPRMTPGKLPNGEGLRKTFVILDDASDVAKSTSWLSIQHPFTGKVSMTEGKLQYSDVRDVTEIVYTEKKPPPKDDEKK